MTLESVLLCDHGGEATPLVPNPRVLIDGAPVITLDSPYLVSGCANAPAPLLLPCVSADFIIGATRVTASGMPVLLATSVAVCVPTGTGLLVIENQEQVNAL